MLVDDDLDQDKGLLPDERTRPSDIPSVALSKEEEEKIQKIIDRARGRGTRTHSYYERLKKDNPTLYWKAETQAQMFDDAIALGDKYQDGDYHKYGPSFY